MFKKDPLKLIGLIFVVASLAACSSSPDDDVVEKVPNRSALALYKEAKNLLKHGNYTRAAETLSSLDSRFPFGALSHQVQLDLIYSYYKSGKHALAIGTIDRFIRLNPGHSDVDYAHYMRGLVNQAHNSNVFQEVFNIDNSDRDQAKTREAFNDFKILIEKYPNSKYAADAKQRMVYLKNRMATYEITIAKYYMKREAYVAAANRGRYVLENFADTTQLQAALEIMVESYDELELEELKLNAMETLRLNFPNSDLLN